MARFAIRVKKVVDGWVLQRMTISHNGSGRRCCFYDPIPWGEIPMEHWHGKPYATEDEAEKAARDIMALDMQKKITYSHAKYYASKKQAV